MTREQWDTDRPLDVAVHVAVVAVTALAIFMILAMAYMPRSTSARLESGDFSTVCIPTIDNGMCRGNFNPSALLDTDRINYTDTDGN